ncbi:FAD:protein FMN transferase [Paracoccus sp. (in: a-proteobacteria)]|uniref:FAD:protein FMN transferase n=1 Tax=Paracoccus sp. TaxID=267 RepID=UPI0026E087F7|nr:FAD:protein FMN transferase [Paracoccus sp. (in: a-proteobacteria)]MDO5646911.1 FAD:protein FMN transferase [Paracoccus sp. (in: a-proteobacteria)]
MQRRRFLTITACAALAGLPARADTMPGDVVQWRGVALGARTTITLGRDDPALMRAVRAEIDRLERIFTLYHPDSALMRLNRGELDAAPPELVECLMLAGRVHDATAGLFDPTVQPLWQAIAQGGDPATAPVGWDGVTITTSRITLRPGMALTLNGIAQGFIADRVAALIRAAGLNNVLIDTGEMVALGPAPNGQPWPIRWPSGGGTGLAGAALASSSPSGMMLPTAHGPVSHILNPLTRTPSPHKWAQISVTAPSAAVADALSTAFCLMPDRRQMDAACDPFRDTRVILTRIA